MNRLTHPLLDGTAHGFFGREGGVSTGLYAGLNVGAGSRDDPAAVAENRRRIALALGTDRLAGLAQVHSPFVHRVDAAWDFALRPEGDAMVTATPGIALGILTADCAPVLFSDPQARVVGAAHAGWKGALGTKDGGGVLEATLDAMESLGARRADIAAVVGPAISQDIYEVGWEMRDRFLELGLRNRKFFVPSDRQGHYRFDLSGYALARLEAAGVRQAARLDVCTYPEEHGYFSFRRTTHRGEPDYGRQLSAILLSE